MADLSQSFVGVDIDNERIQRMLAKLIMREKKNLQTRELTDL